MRSLVTLLSLAATFCMVLCDDVSLLPDYDVYHTRYEGYPRYKENTPRPPVRFAPCRTKITYNCLRNYFSKYGHCSRVDQPIENPTYYNLNLPLYIPVIKTVAIVVQATLFNLDGKVERFYEENDNVVITVRFGRLTGVAPGAIFVIDRDGEEPAVITEYGNATYPSDMTLTAVFPKDNGMISHNSLRNANYYAYFPKNDASIFLGPKLTQSSDPAVQEMLIEFINKLPDVCKEIFRTKATLYFLAFLQIFICDYGVQPLREKYDTSLVSLLQDVDTDHQTKIKPCAGFVDKNACVREFFKAYQTCTPIYYPKPSPLIRTNHLAYIPSVNSTAVLPYSEVSGLNGRIKDFYINEEAGVCVLVVEFRGLAVDTEDTEIIHYREGEVPHSITGLTTVKYHVTLTATLSLKDGRVVTRESVEKAFVSANADPCDTTIEFGCNIADSKDPEVQAVVDGVQKHLMMAVGEIMVTSANSHFTNFMQSNICDWGIPTWYSKFF